MQREDIARLLPEIFQRTLPNEPPVLAALLGVMETLHTPAEQMLATLDSYVDPDLTPDRFIPFLARWVGLDIFLEQDEQGRPHFASGLGRIRDLILASGELARWRGTKEGLIRTLEIATGQTGFTVSELYDQPYHIIVTYPPTAAPYAQLLRRLVDLEKPAYVTCEVLEQSNAIN